MLKSIGISQCRYIGSNLSGDCFTLFAMTLEMPVIASPDLIGTKQSPDTSGIRRMLRIGIPEAKQHPAKGGMYREKRRG